MATSAAILITRNYSETTTQSCDILVNDTVPNYWLWTARNIGVSLTDSQVQAFITANVAAYLAEIAANDEAPLTAEQVAQYQDFIDIKKATDKIALLNADIDLITVASPDPNASSGYKAAFTAAAFGALTANQQTVLIRNTISAMLTMLLDIMRSVRLLLNIAKRRADTGGSLAQSLSVKQ